MTLRPSDLEILTTTSTTAGSELKSSMPEATVEPVSNDQASLLSPASCFTPPPLVQQVQQSRHELQHRIEERSVMQDFATTPSASVAVLERNWDISDDASDIDQHREPSEGAANEDDLEEDTVGGSDDGEANSNGSSSGDNEQNKQAEFDTEEKDGEAEDNNANDAESRNSNSSRSSSSSESSDEEVRDDYEDEDYNENNDENDDQNESVDAEDPTTVDLSSNANAAENQTKQKQGKESAASNSKQKEAQEKVTIESLNAFDVLKYYEILN